MPELDLLREAAHTMEVAIRFAQHGLGPTDEELTEWREVMYRLKAAVLADRAARWMPIESAPKDGTWYLATDGVDRWTQNEPPKHYAGEWHWNAERGQWRGSANGATPTLWQPLPAPPTEHHSGDNCMSRWPFPVSKESKGSDQ